MIMKIIQWKKVSKLKVFDKIYLHNSFKKYIHKLILLKNNVQFLSYEHSQYKITAGNYGFNFFKMIKTIIIDYDFKLKIKVTIKDHNFNHLKKKIHSHYDFMMWMYTGFLNRVQRMDLSFFKWVTFVQNSIMGASQGCTPVSRGSVNSEIALSPCYRLNSKVALQKRIEVCLGASNVSCGGTQNPNTEETVPISQNRIYSFVSRGSARNSSS